MHILSERGTIKKNSINCLLLCKDRVDELGQGCLVRLLTKDRTTNCQKEKDWMQRGAAFLRTVNSSC